MAHLRERFCFHILESMAQYIKCVNVTFILAKKYYWRRILLCVNIASDLNLLPDMRSQETWEKMSILNKWVWYLITDC